MIKETNFGELYGVDITKYILSNQNDFSVSVINYGATVTNNIANGCGIRFESDASIDFDASTVTLHGGAAINAETSCLFSNFFLLYIRIKK